jgi:hypothetical protein
MLTKDTTSLGSGLIGFARGELNGKEYEGEEDGDPEPHDREDFEWEDLAAEWLEK